MLSKLRIQSGIDVVTVCFLLAIMYSSFPEDMFLATLCKVFDLLDSMELANQYTGANSVIPCINKQSVLNSNAIGQPCSAIIIANLLCMVNIAPPV